MLQTSALHAGAAPAAARILAGPLSVLRDGGRGGEARDTRREWMDGGWTLRCW